MSNEQTQQQDKLMEVIQELMPDIERDIRTELKQQFENELQQKLQQMQAEMKSEAGKQIEEKVTALQAESIEKFKKKKELIEQSEQNFERLKRELEKEYTIQIQQSLNEQFQQEREILLKSVFDDMTKNQAIVELESQVKDRIKLEYEEEMKNEVYKKEKLLKLNYKKKFEIEKKNLEEQLQNQMSLEIEKELTRLQKERADVTRQISLKNIKMKEIDEEKKQLKFEQKQQEEHFSTQITELQKQLDQLIEEKEKKNQQKMIEQQQQQKKQINKSSISYNGKSVSNIMIEDETRQKLLESQFQNKENNLNDSNKSPNKNTKIQSESPKIFNNLSNKFQLQSHPNQQQLQQQAQIQFANQRQSLELPRLEQESYQQNNFSPTQNKAKNEVDFDMKYLGLNKSPFQMSLTHKLNINNPNQVSQPINQDMNQFSHHIFDPMSPPELLSLKGQFNQQLQPLNNLTEQDQQLDGNLNQISDNQEKFQLLKEYNTKEIAESLIKSLTSQYTQGKSFSLIKPQSSFIPEQKNDTFHPNKNNDNSNNNLYMQQQQSVFNQIPFNDKSSIIQQQQNTESCLFQQQQQPVQNKQINPTQEKYQKILCNLQKNLNSYDFLNEKSQINKKLDMDNLDQSVKEEALVEKYEELMQKYVGKQQNDDNQKKKQNESKNSKYEQIFAIQTKDQSKIKELKILRKLIFSVIENEQEHQTKYEQQQKYFLEEFPMRITLNMDYDTVKKKVNFELEYLSVQQIGEIEELLFEKLHSRQIFRNQIGIHSSEFSYKFNKRFYAAIKNIDQEISDLLFQYQQLRKKQFMWKGISVADLIKVDKWEDEVLQKEDLKNEILKKVKKKLN